MTGRPSVSDDIHPVGRAHIWWRPVLVGVSLLGVALLLSACGGDDDDDATPTATTSATATASPSMTATPDATTTPDGDATPAGVGEAFPGLPLEEITDLQIAGDTVTITSRFGVDEESRATDLCEQLLVFARFSPTPQVVVLAEGGTSELARCS